MAKRSKRRKKRTLSEWVFIVFAIVMAVSLLLPIVAQLLGQGGSIGF